MVSRANQWLYDDDEYDEEFNARYPGRQRKVVIKAKVRPLPPFPTSAPPGSVEKVDVMRSRHEQGYQLWHPEDERLNDSDELSEDRLNQLVEMMRMIEEVRGG